MNIFFWGSLIFLSLFGVHILLWRIHLPKRQTRALLLIFFGGLVCSLITIVHILPTYLNFSLFQITNMFEIAHVILYVTSLTLGYIITYSAIEAQSPSVVMIDTIHRAGPEGLEEQAFARMIDDDVLVNPRIADLLRDLMVFKKNDKYHLTSKGRRFVKIFIFYRNLLKAKKGG